MPEKYYDSNTLSLLRVKNKPIFDSDICCIRCGYWYTPEAFIDSEHVCTACRRLKEGRRASNRNNPELLQALNTLISVSQNTETGIIYLIQGERTKLTKVGFTATNPLRRLKELQTGSPDVLSLLGWFYGSYDVERSLHILLEPFNSHGEWFELIPSVYSCFKKYFQKRFVDFGEN